MDKKTYNIIAAVVAKLNPAYEAAIEASLPVLAGAILTICGNFVIEEGKKNETK